MRDVTIGEAARSAGVAVQTVRFYEARGLLPPPPRSDGNRRLYGPQDVRRLRFIRRARGLGFPLAAVATLLDLADDPARPCREADRLAQEQLDDVRARLALLRDLETELMGMLQRCVGEAAGECRVIDALAGGAEASAAGDPQTRRAAPGSRPRPATRNLQGQDGPGRSAERPHRGPVEA